MIDTVLQTIAPHYCYGCNDVGKTLCGSCKYDIIHDPFSGCIVCLKPSVNGVCKDCHAPYSWAWCVGERTDVIEKLIDAYKFERTRAAYKSLSDLLDTALPTLPRSTVIIPIPTIRQHIRQRGYDHTLLVAKDLAKRRNLPYKTLLDRRTNKKQLGASKRERLQQAKEAFSVRGTIDPERYYLLIDDVYTTGATMHYAAQALKDAGAKEVWIAVIARQVSTDML